MENLEFILKMVEVPPDAAVSPGTSIDEILSFSNEISLLRDIRHINVLEHSDRTKYVKELVCSLAEDLVKGTNIVTFGFMDVVPSTLAGLPRWIYNNVAWTHSCKGFDYWQKLHYNLLPSYSAKTKVALLHLDKEGEYKSLNYIISLADNPEAWNNPYPFLHGTYFRSAEELKEYVWANLSPAYSADLQEGDSNEAQ
jgi:hypothetical protein